MDREQEGAPQPDGAREWRELFCICTWCRAERWLVRLTSRREVWQVAQDDGASPWLIAAHTPICPLCGEDLAAHIEGIGEPEQAGDNAFVRYIRALRPAA
jgi:hypothetical protein